MYCPSILYRKSSIVKTNSSVPGIIADNSKIIQLSWGWVFPDLRVLVSISKLSCFN